MIVGPDYAGGSIANVAAELEARLTGDTPGIRLAPELAALIPEAPSYVLVLFDGMGDGQLSHPAAGSLASSRVGAVDAPFPTTTTVSLSTVSTALPPVVHGLIGYELWLPEADAVVRTIHWTTQHGKVAAGVDHASFLPGPNLWERLAAAGIEPMTIQPWGFESSPLSRVLYRGCRFEPYGSEREAGEAAAQLAATPGRLVFLYVPHVDVAAHVSGQASPEYTDAMRAASAIWTTLSNRLDGSVAVAIADHGHIDIPVERRIAIPREEHADREFYGDGRALFVRGRDALALGDILPATAVPLDDALPWFGPGTPHPSFEDRAPDAVLLSDPGYAILHRHANDRLIGHHGGLTDPERRVPLLVAAR